MNLSKSRIQRKAELVNLKLEGFFVRVLALNFDTANNNNKSNGNKSFADNSSTVPAKPWRFFIAYLSILSYLFGAPGDGIVQWRLLKRFFCDSSRVAWI